MRHHFPPLTDQARAKKLPLPSLPWGEILIMAFIGILLLRMP